MPRPLFSPAECGQIIAAFRRFPAKRAGLVTDRGTRIADDSKFKAAVSHALPDCLPPWITQRIDEVWRPYRLSEWLRFNRCRVGDHLYWHGDWTPLCLEAFRVLSMSVQLSDPADYAGGLVELQDRTDIITAPTDQGTATVFNSGRIHQVIEVTAGTRCALVHWARRQSRR